MKDLSSLRAEIDHLDKQLWEIIAQRMDIAREIGEWKHTHGEPVLQSNRYQQVLGQCAFDIHSPVHGFAVFPKIAPPHLVILSEFYIIRWVEGEVGIEKDAFSRVGDFHEIPSSIALCRAAMV